MVSINPTSIGQTFVHSARQLQSSMQYDDDSYNDGYGDPTVGLNVPDPQAYPGMEPEWWAWTKQHAGQILAGVILLGGGVGGGYWAFKSRHGIEEKPQNKISSDPSSNRPPSLEGNNSSGDQNWFAKSLSAIKGGAQSLGESISAGFKNTRQAVGDFGKSIGTGLQEVKTKAINATRSSWDIQSEGSYRDTLNSQTYDEVIMELSGLKSNINRKKTKIKNFGRLNRENAVQRKLAIQELLVLRAKKRVARQVLQEKIRQDGELVAPPPTTTATS